MAPCPAAPALSDGIYAIAMTLLVINVAIPAHLDDAAFHKALSDALPHLGAFALSFTLIAGFWRDHRRILTALPAEQAVITRLTLLGLGWSPCCCSPGLRQHGSSHDLGRPAAWE
ncbi:TMEM175 family protein [Streptomyces mirabilis]|uniref:TMEM175 family protein n=1 Tax=Streptomyces mirabilis TaxID=68239 RepID=UPI00362FA4DD